MKKILFWILASILGMTGYAQDNAAQELVDQGIALHDKGEFEAAIKKYEAAIENDNKYVNAYYEKAYSLHAMKKFKECSEFCQATLARFKGAPGCKRVYMIYGNCMDDMREPEQAIDIYNEGIKQFPDFYLLYYNKGVTLSGLGKNDDAIVAFEKAVSLNPEHASSNKAICLLMAGKNKIRSLMAGLVFLCYEPEGARAADVLTVVKKQLAGNVKKDGEKNVTIMINPEDLETGKKKQQKENNFGMVNMMISLMSGMNNDSTMKTIGEEERLSLKIQFVINSLSEQKKDGKGFYWDRYVPFLIEMKSNSQVSVFAHIALASDKAANNLTWLNEHKNEVAGFYDWLKAYKWTN